MSKNGTEPNIIEPLLCRGQKGHQDKRRSRSYAGSIFGSYQSESAVTTGHAATFNVILKYHRIFGHKYKHTASSFYEEECKINICNNENDMYPKKCMIKFNCQKLEVFFTKFGL